MGLVGDVMAGLVELAFPALCYWCERPLRPSSEDFCPACDAALTADRGPHCPRCTDQLVPHVVPDRIGCGRCRHLDLQFDACVRLGPYQHLWKGAVLRCKHANGELLAEALGRLLARQHAVRLREWGCAMVVPVPLHWTRRLARGYNQAAALAAGLAQSVGLPCALWALRRTRSTPPQTERTYEQRSSNVRGAFALAVDSSRFRGQTVLLVDDVYTSASTLNECARLLRRAGAVRVVAAVVAHGKLADVPTINSPATKSTDWEPSGSWATSATQAD